MRITKKPGAYTASHLSIKNKLDEFSITKVNGKDIIIITISDKDSDFFQVALAMAGYDKSPETMIDVWSILNYVGEFENAINALKKCCKEEGFRLGEAEVRDQIKSILNLS